MCLALRSPLKEYLWCINLSEKDVHHLFPEENFWTVVFKAWCNFNYSVSDSCVNVRNQILWMNSNIRLNKKPFIFPNYVNANIWKIKDILSEDNGEFMTYEELKMKFTVCTSWLEYETLKNSIPLRWRHTFQMYANRQQTETDQKYEYKYELLKNTSKVSSVVYRSMVNNSCALYDSYNQWLRTLEETFQLSFDDYERLFININRITNSTKLRDFQFRLLHHKVPTNYELYLWKIRNDKQLL